MSDAWNETNLRAELAAVKAERNAALAVIEEVRQAPPTWHRGMYGCPDNMHSAISLRRILDQTPAAALAEVKADAWAEGYERGIDVANGDSDDPTNPYRTEAT